MAGGGVRVQVRVVWGERVALIGRRPIPGHAHPSAPLLPSAPSLRVVNVCTRASSHNNTRPLVHRPAVPEGRPPGDCCMKGAVPLVRPGPPIQTAVSPTPSIRSLMCQFEVGGWLAGVWPWKGDGQRG